MGWRGNGFQDRLRAAEERADSLICVGFGSRSSPVTRCAGPRQRSGRRHRQVQPGDHRSDERSRLDLQAEFCLLSSVWSGRRRRAPTDPPDDPQPHSSLARLQGDRYGSDRGGLCPRLFRRVGFRRDYRQSLHGRGRPGAVPGLRGSRRHLDLQDQQSRQRRLSRTRNSRPAAPSTSRSPGAPTTGPSATPRRSGSWLVRPTRSN